MKDKIIEFKKDIQNIGFSDIPDRNPFTNEEWDEIICFQIDVLFRRHFPKFANEQEREE